MKRALPVLMCLLAASCSQDVRPTPVGATYIDAVCCVVQWSERTQGKDYAKDRALFSIRPDSLADKRAIQAHIQALYPALSPAADADDETTDAPGVPSLALASDELDQDFLQFHVNTGYTLSGSVYTVNVRLINGKWTVVSFRMIGMK